MSFIVAGCEIQNAPITQPAQSSVPTSSPTTSPEDELQLFTELIRKDINCNLPCWLDITPGQTEFATLEDNFSRFRSIAATEFSSERALVRVFFPDSKIAAFDLITGVTPGEDGTISQIWVSAGIDPKGINQEVSYSDPQYQKLMQRYFLPGIFSGHGLPELIFLDTTLIAVDDASSYPFVLWVVYAQNGFFIRYQGTNEKIEDKIRICPMKSRIEINIWDTKTSTYEDFMKNDSALGSISLGPQPIETVTDFNRESFYNLFKDGNIESCFDTPTEIWPPN